MSLGKWKRKKYSKRLSIEIKSFMLRGVYYLWNNNAMLTETKSIITKYNTATSVLHISMASHWSNLIFHSQSFIHDLFLYPWTLLKVMFLCSDDF